MKIDSRTAASFVVMVAFAASLVATSKPKKDAGGPSGAIYASVKVALGGATEPGRANAGDLCTKEALQALAPQVAVPQSWRQPERLSIVLFEAETAARFAPSNAITNNPDDDFRFVNSFLVRDLLPLTYSAFENSETKTKEKLGAIATHPFFAIAKAEERRPPALGSDGKFTGGVYAGTIVVARFDTGTPVCRIPFEARSSEEVAFKTRGLLGKSAEKAMKDDFEQRVGAALQGALKKAAPSYSFL